MMEAQGMKFVPQPTGPAQPLPAEPASGVGADSLQGTASGVPKAENVGGTADVSKAPRPTQSAPAFVPEILNMEVLRDSFKNLLRDRIRLGMNVEYVLDQIELILKVHLLAVQPAKAEPGTSALHCRWCDEGNSRVVSSIDPTGQQFVHHSGAR